MKSENQIENMTTMTNGADSRLSTHFFVSSQLSQSEAKSLQKNCLQLACILAVLLVLACGKSAEGYVSTALDKPLVS